MTKVAERETTGKELRWIEGFARSAAIRDANLYEQYETAERAGDLAECDRIAAKVGYPHDPPQARESMSDIFAASITPFSDDELEAAREPHPHAFQDGDCGLFPIGEVSVIAAPGREGKTFATIGLAASFVLGNRVVGLKPQGDKSVLIYSAEDSRDQYARKVLARRCRLGAKDADRVRERIIVPDLWADGMDQFRTLIAVADRTPIDAGIVGAVIDSLQPRMSDPVPPGLIVFETVSTLSDADEDNRALKLLVRALRRVARELQVAVVLVHHVSQAALTNLATLDLSVADIRGGTALVANSRQNALLVNLGSDDDPFPDADARTLLRKMAAPDLIDRVSVMVTLDSSKSVDPPPVFFAWNRTEYGPAVSVIATPPDLNRMSWRNVRRRIQGQRAERRQASKDAASAGKVDEVVSIVDRLAAQGQPATVKSVSTAAGRGAAWAAPYLERAVSDGLLERAMERVPRVKEPVAVYRVSSPL